MEAALTGQLFGYGVWRAPVLIEGLPAIWAVDSFGVVQKVRKIRPGDDVEALGERLWLWLREHHPERKLELVRESAPTPRPKREIDPRLLTDPRSPLVKRAYMDRLVKNAARKASALQLRRDD